MVAGCELVRRELSNYIDKDVDAALRLAMDEHFQSCRQCASLLAGTRNVVRLYGDERMIEAPAGFGKRLQDKLAGCALRKVRAWSSWSAWLIPAATIALIITGYKLTTVLTFRPPAQSILALPANNIPPNLQVVVSDGSRVFHIPGCRYIHDKASERTLTAKEAIRQGYVPCSRCLRKYLKVASNAPAGLNGTVAPESEETSEEEESASGMGR